MNRFEKAARDNTRFTRKTIVSVNTGELWKKLRKLHRDGSLQGGMVELQYRYRDPCNSVRKRMCLRTTMVSMLWIDDLPSGMQLVDRLWRYHREDSNLVTWLSCTSDRQMSDQIIKNRACVFTVMNKDDAPDPWIREASGAYGFRAMSNDIEIGIALYPKGIDVSKLPFSQLS